MGGSRRRHGSEGEKLAVDELERRIREADGDELLELIDRHGDELGVPAVRQALRNPFVTVELIERLLEFRRLLAIYEIRRDLASHPRTPEVAALRHLPGLYWRDLLRVSLDLRVRPKVRQAAEKHLGNRLPSLSLGERISIARIAGPSLLAQLRHEPHAMVFAAVLENPKLTEGSLLAVANAQSTSGEQLATLARNSRWGTRHALRLALVRNRRTPLEVALGILPSLRKTDLRTLMRERGLAPALRDRARLLLGDGRGGAN